ncbi:BQ2448_481 [Microbotryum intermedium]|uniref:BQ2448_481 protein n=1 Tax=Microbotryum intermedium TaxID=269621 RepID=A0A238F2K6_9BASI|nr:BQ2448_481 [Microbotryum intermedium]
MREVSFETLISLDPPFLPYDVAEFISRSYLCHSEWSIEQEALFYSIPSTVWAQLDVYVQAIWNMFDGKVRENGKMGDRLQVERERMNEVMNGSGYYLTQHRHLIINSYNAAHPNLKPLTWSDNLVNSIRRGVVFASHLEPNTRSEQDDDRLVSENEGDGAWCDNMLGSVSFLDLCDLVVIG